MKNIFIHFFALFLILLAISSCATVKKKNKTLCDCLEIVLNNPEMRKDTVPPAGCEWLKDISDEEGQKLIMKTKTDCPEVYKKLFNQRNRPSKEGSTDEMKEEEEKQ